MDLVAVCGAWAAAIVAGVRYARRPPPHLAVNPRKGWWTRENTAKRDVTFGRAVFFGLAVLIISWVSLEAVLHGGAWAIRHLL